VPRVSSRHRLSREQRCLCREHLALGKGCESGSAPPRPGLPIVHTTALEFLHPNENVEYHSSNFYYLYLCKIKVY
jgi:hypothetical protein